MAPARPFGFVPQNACIYGNVVACAIQPRRKDSTTSIGGLTSQIAAAGQSRQLDYQVETTNEGIPVRSGGVPMSAGR
jgi:hypothetical protein